MRKSPVLLLILGSLLSSRQALADTAEDRAAADTLFREARTLAEAKDFAQACPKFAASHKLDPKPGRLLALADCYEQKGDTASAWSTFREAASVARTVHDDAREKEAVRRAEQLEPNLSKIVVNVSANAGTEGLEVRRNGKVVAEALWGTAFPVDAGPQLIEVVAPGKAKWTRMVDVPAKLGTTSVDIPALQVAAGPSEPPKTPPESPKKSLPLIIVGGAAALVGIGVGVGLVVSSPRLRNEAEVIRDGMPEAVCNTAHPQHANYLQQCRDLSDKLAQKDTFVNVGTIVVVAGAVFTAATLTYVALPGPKKGATSFWFAPVIAPGLSGISANGRF